jgi:hypothetical protein
MQRGPIDHHLPFEFTKLEKLLGLLVAEEFYDKQWEFTAPSFSGSVIPRKLPNEFVLPFVSDEWVGESFGAVHRIQVERSYQQFDRSQDSERAKDSWKAAQNLCNILLPQQSYWFKPYCDSIYLGSKDWTSLGIASLLGFRKFPR